MSIERGLRMRRLFPTAADDVDPHVAYTLPASGRRHLRVNMVSSADGAAAIGGRVGALSGPADAAMLHLLRALADVILVGAGTIRAEGYGPALLPAEDQRRREAAGQSPLPPLAILSRGLDLNLTASLFTRATARPIILTCADAPADRRAAAEELADVTLAGADRVDLPTALDALADRGLTKILSEGGPHVLAELFAVDQVDELCLTLAPLVTNGHQLRITAGPPLPHPADLRLTHVLEQDQTLFLRYTRPQPRSTCVQQSGRHD